MKKQATKNTARLFGLHLAPGALATVAFVAIGAVAPGGWPPALIFLVTVSVTLLPWEGLFVWHAARGCGFPGRNGGGPRSVGPEPVSGQSAGQQSASSAARVDGRMADVLRLSIPRWQAFVPACLFGLVWAAAAFVLLDGVLTKPLRDAWLPMFPHWFALGDYVHRPSAYTAEIRILTWSAMALLSVVIPTAEELYFRGWLLSRMEHLGNWAPLLNSVLFALYHFWSPWMLPVRIIAILPYVWLSHRYRSVWIGIVAHVSLNLIGDVILVAPLVFGP